ncbi:MAG: HD domain-containing protein [Bacteroidetes bacterium]|nr:HD domain-containing protein [Bacteroidota bacterium]
MDYRKLIEALDFAAYRHKNQTRKGVGKVPYINHPVKVAKILADAGEEDLPLLIAALLHDVIEDTAKGEEEIQALSHSIADIFGQDVLQIVLEVSDDKSLPVEERKRLQVVHTPNLSDQAKKLKIADKISNIQDIEIDPPESWTKERKLAYLDWAKQVVEGAGGLNHELDQYFNRVYHDVYSKLNQP